MSERQYYVYILASQKYGTLYIGITSNLINRVYQHKKGVVAGFTKKYHIYKLVYYEAHCDARGAILREKQMKEWRRDWKINLIERDNPYWLDLYCELSP
jgi:putative endonuclease